MDNYLIETVNAFIFEIENKENVLSQKPFKSYKILTNIPIEIFRFNRIFRMYYDLNEKQQHVLLLLFKHIK